MKAGERDATHLPVIYLKAHEFLSPGEWVGIDGDLTKDGCEGIVDPFGPEVPDGELCAVWVPAEKTTTVRHVWEYLPDKPDPPSDDWPWEAYLEQAAEKLKVNSMWLLEAAEHVAETGSSVGGIQISWDFKVEFDWEEFWRRYNRQFGTKVGW